VSSKGPQAANPNPFVEKLPIASVGTTTFINVGASLGDTESIQIPTASEKPGSGIVAKSICILLDASGSMSEDSKMDKAKASAASVLRRLGADTEVALIVFYGCGTITVEHPFTTDASAIIPVLSSIQPSGGTPLAGATAFAKTYIRQHASSSSSELILLTDGQETCGGDPITAASN
jgi:Mg-chelatase subunit ChlD